MRSITRFLQNNPQEIEKVKKRILNKIKVDANGCWLWQGYYTFRNCGYATFTLGGNTYAAHRISFAIFKPDLFNEYLNICHKCNVRLCLNPDHLYCGTQKDNISDAIKRGTHISAIRSRSSSAEIVENINS